MKTAVDGAIDTGGVVVGAWDALGHWPLAASRRAFSEDAPGSDEMSLVMRVPERYRFRATFFWETAAKRVLGEPDAGSVVNRLYGA